jgi:hypothetical protein
VSDPLTVDVNRTHLHSVEVPDSVSRTGSFDIELHNHGEAVHVHVHLDDTLSAVASVDAINHHLRPGAVRRVPVIVRRDDRSATGRLKVASAYGAETRYVDLSLEAVRPSKPPVEVDAALAEPSPDAGRSRGSSSSGGGRESRSGSGSMRSRSGGRSDSGSGLESALPAGLDAPAAALGVATLFLAVVAVVAIDSAILLAGAFVLLAGIVAAGYVSLQ